MIAKPFFNRFKSSDQEKQDRPVLTEEKLLLKLLSFSLKLQDDDNTLLKISRTLSFSLDVDTVCISEVSNNEVKLRQIFYDGENTPAESEKWDINSINSEIISSKHEQYYESLAHTFPNQPIIENFKAASFYGAPAINDEGNITAIINIFHSKMRKFTHYENEILKLMAQRSAQFFQHEKLQQEQKASEAHQGNETGITEQLRQTTEQLNETNKSLDSLSFAVSHELRAPLRSVDNFSKALAEDFSSNLPDDALDYVSRIRKACVRMGDMIDDLLWLARVTRRNLELQNIDLSKLISKIVNELVDAEEEERNIVLDIQTNVLVVADKELLKIALQHLLSNAIKFSRQQEDAKIDFFTEKQGDKLIYVIRDNGRGFDMAYYEQLFDPFKKLHNSTKFDGTGIGLATVERIIERHQGKIWAESDTDEGATFYFTLPNG